MNAVRHGALAALLLLLSACHCGGPPTAQAPTDAADASSDGAADDAGGGEGAGASCLPLSGEGTPLLTNLMGARRLAADETHLYVTVTGPLSQSNGYVARVPLTGGLAETVASGFRAPDAVAAANGAVFVLEHGGLWRIDAATFAKTRIDATVNNALFGGTDLVLDGEWVIAATGLRWLVRVKQDGTSASFLHVAGEGTAIRGLARDGATLFFLVAEGPAPGVYQVPLDGSAPATRVRKEPSTGLALLVDGARYVWTEGVDGQAQVSAAPVGKGAVETLAAGLQRAGRLARVGEAIYVTDAPAQASPEFLRGIASCGTHLAGPAGVGPGDLLFLGGVLYFASQDLSGQGYVSRLP